MTGPALPGSGYVHRTGALPEPRCYRLPAFVDMGKRQTDRVRVGPDVPQTMMRQCAAELFDCLGKVAGTSAERADQVFDSGDLFVAEDLRSARSVDNIGDVFRSGGIVLG